MQRPSHKLSTKDVRPEISISGKTLKSIRFLLTGARLLIPKFYDSRKGNKGIGSAAISIELEKGYYKELRFHFYVVLPGTTNI